MTTEEEFTRLHGKPIEHTRVPGEIVVEFGVHCAGDAEDVLHRAKEVLLAVVQQQGWPAIDEWRQRLPAWFVERSGPEISEAEAKRRLTLSFKERSKLNERWSVGAFLFWLMPAERQWFWWDAKIFNSNFFEVRVLAFELPFAWESLIWLLKASGALSVDEP